MSTNKSVILSSVLFSTLFILSACGEEGDSSGTAAEADDATTKVFMHDQEVIYQDEIYANWPYN